MYVVPCGLLRKIYNNKIMVKNKTKLNRKHCSHDAWERFYLIFLPLFFFTIILLFIS